jgi:hypothetical protein
VLVNKTNKVKKSILKEVFNAIKENSNVGKLSGEKRKTKNKEE